MTEETPWRHHLLRGAVLLLAILVFQQVARGELTPSVAVFAAVGYIVVAELIRRWSD